MSNEQDYLFLKPGTTVLLARTENPYAALYTEKLLRVIMADPTGVLAQLAKDDSGVPQPILFVNFDGTTTLSFLAPGFVAQFDPILPNSLVIDLETNTQMTMDGIYPQFFTQQAEARAAAAAAPPPPPPPAAPVFQADDPLRDFQPGTVFKVVSTDNPAVARYVNRVFQISHADSKGVVALPDYNSGLTEAVFIPFDGFTSFETNTPGTFRFASGLAAGQQVWNASTSTYIVVEDFCPAYGYAYDPFYQPYYCDSFVPAVGFGIGLGLGLGVVYDPWYVDPYPYYW